MSCILAKRQDVMLGLLKLAQVLRVLSFSGLYHMPWANALPALNLLGNFDQDILAANLGFLSEYLFDYDPSSWDDEKFPDPMTAGPEIFHRRYHQGGLRVNRNRPRLEHFHRLYTFLGYAACRMPRLKSTTVSMEHGYNKFRFDPGSFAVKPTLKWASHTGYKPGKRVASAWGFRLQDADLSVYGQGWGDWFYREIDLKVTFEQFPFSSADGAIADEGLG
ncbi:hypothetical protein BJX70DRAFT_396473 [Aspergillus crustosus]